MKFGTSGLRGLVSDLEGRASALYATAFARHLIQSGQVKSGGPILVGRDFRPSSPSIAATCIGALARCGLVPIDCGTLPTPALALYGISINAPSLMITGSHIPADRNGIKFYLAFGEIDKADEVAIAAIADLAFNDEIDVTPGQAQDRSQDAIRLFADRAKSILPARALTGLKIGVYQHSTVARDLLVETMMHYGATIVELGRSETFVPVDTEAVSRETVAQLQDWTAAFGLDAIVSADGDGDRPLLSDEHGHPVRGDLLGLVSAIFLGADAIATPVSSNSGIESNGNFTTLRTRIGSPYVIAGMADLVSQGYSKVVGFEANGGLLTASPFSLSTAVLSPLPTRDSFLPILATLFVCLKKKIPLSQLAGSFQMPHTMADRLEEFPVEASAALMAKLRLSDQELQSFLSPIGQVRSKSDIDGLRITLEDGRLIHFRPSGNAPELRCYVEASSERDAVSLLNDGMTLLKRWQSHNIS